MNHYVELIQEIIEKCKTEGACEGQFKQLIKHKDNPVLAIRVLLNNHSWCIGKKIYTAESILRFDPDLLKTAGLLTQQTAPVSFDPVVIGGLTFAGMNHGASIENINGTYHTFDNALELDYGKDWRQPDQPEQSVLSGAPHQWGVYAGMFGMVFSGDDGSRLFFPASGYRNSSNGSFNGVTTSGTYWSSSVNSATSGLNLTFNSSWVYPQDDNNRSNGFPVRCVASVP